MRFDPKVVWGDAYICEECGEDWYEVELRSYTEKRSRDGLIVEVGFLYCPTCCGKIYEPRT